MLRAILRNVGIRPGGVVATLRGWRRYVRGRKEFRRRAGVHSMRWGRELPMLTEWQAESGVLGAYFHQDQLVARWIYEAGPRRHVDVGSRLDGFIGSLSVFREVEVIDIRPQTARVTNVTFHQLDLMTELPERWVAATDSLSCLHTIEHFGLGRYGDKIDPAGHLRGLEQLKRMVEVGGMLYLSTPVGPERVEFNAHRIFAVATIAGWFEEGWRVERCAVLDDTCTLHEDVDMMSREAAGNFGCNCGLLLLGARKEGGTACTT